MKAEELGIAALHRARPRAWFVRGSVAVLGLLVGYAWLGGDVDAAGLFAERRRENLARFLTEDALPPPLRQRGLDGLGAWVGAILDARGAEATALTLAIAVLAVVLAGLAALVLAPAGARTLMRPDPFRLPPEDGGLIPGFRRALAAAVRLVLVLLRAIPEFVWAFLFLAMLGPTAWPAVLALAIHNAGILGRLGADTVENLDAGPLRALRMLGASRRGLAVAAVLPLGFSRFLVYFFVRFESCVREATVLGMLGVVSLGYWIEEARSRQLYDEMLLLVVLGAGLVLAADLVSQVARAWIRRGA